MSHSSKKKNKHFTLKKARLILKNTWEAISQLGSARYSKSGDKCGLARHDFPRHKEITE